jgi:hypothetical protein
MTRTPFPMSGLVVHHSALLLATLSDGRPHVCRGVRVHFTAHSILRSSTLHHTTQPPLVAISSGMRSGSRLPRPDTCITLTAPRIHSVHICICHCCALDSPTMVHPPTHTCDVCASVAPFDNAGGAVGCNQFIGREFEHTTSCAVRDHTHTFQYHSRCSHSCTSNECDCGQLAWLSWCVSALPSTALAGVACTAESVSCSVR